MSNETTTRLHRIRTPRRLVRVLRRQALLSHGEAVAALRDYRQYGTAYGEAIRHYGGVVRALQDAIPGEPDRERDDE